MRETKYNLKRNGSRQMIKNWKKENFQQIR